MSDYFLVWWQNEPLDLRRCHSSELMSNRQDFHFSSSKQSEPVLVKYLSRTWSFRRDYRYWPVSCPVITWWRHQMETFSALLALCVGNSPVNGEFPSQRQVTRSFDVFFDLCLNKRFSKRSWGWWFETQSDSLWRHCNGRDNHFGVTIVIGQSRVQL